MRVPPLLSEPGTASALAWFEMLVFCWPCHTSTIKKRWNSNRSNLPSMHKTNWWHANCINISRVNLIVTANPCSLSIARPNRTKLYLIRCQSSNQFERRKCLVAGGLVWSTDKKRATGLKNQHSSTRCPRTNQSIVISRQQCPSRPSSHGDGWSMSKTSKVSMARSWTSADWTALVGVLVREILIPKTRKTKTKMGPAKRSINI